MITGTLYSGFGAGGAAGLIAAYPKLAARTAQILTPAGGLRLGLSPQDGI